MLRFKIGRCQGSEFKLFFPERATRHWEESITIPEKVVLKTE